MPRPAAKPASPPRYIHKLVMHDGAPRPSVDVEEIDLRARISELERLLAVAPATERRRREQARLLVPADEDQVNRSVERELTKLEKRAIVRERRRQILTCFVLVAALIGLLNLLAHLLRV
ncbi:MAG: hypothetical protein ACKV19_26580 [Verrucomicrobiales bacterium]